MRVCTPETTPPIHLLFHAIERAQFGRDWLGYHLVNVVVHALNSVLLAVLLLRWGASRQAALLGGLVFAVHPANVEAVAWISQLKSTGALAFALLGMLSFDRRPAISAVCFALGLLTKASAAFALPMLVAAVWVRGRDAGPQRWGWTAVWCVIFGLYALPQFASFQHIGAVEIEAFDDPMTHLRTVSAIGARYLAMAVSSFGVSAFAEPQPIESWWNGYWLAGLFAGTALACRTFWAISARRPEAVWWVAAAASFVPVSQIFPFLIPVADRYLYFILPGLIGGIVLFGDEMLRHYARSKPGQGPIGEVVLRRGVMLVVAAGVVLFSVHSHERAALWQDENLLLVDAALHYPDGGTAHYLRARRAAGEGNYDEAVASLRRASERGLNRFQSIGQDPAFAAMRSTSTFRSLIFELAGRWIEQAKIGSRSTQPELLTVARAHLVRQETCEGMQTLELALARGGPLDEVVGAELASLRSEWPDGCGIDPKEARHRREAS